MISQTSDMPPKAGAARTVRVAVCSRSFSKNPTLRAELLARYRHVTFNDAGAQLQGDALVAFLKGHEKAITALEVIDESILSRLPELKVIGKYGVGLDMIDLAAMRNAKTKPGVLVTDYEMDEMNGLDLIQSSHKIHPALKTVLVSGTVDSSITIGHAAKVNRFLGKPYDPAQLQKAVAELMRL